MSVVELIAQADGRALAASGLACLDRCVPLLGADDEVLRPLWGSLAADGADEGEWGRLLTEVRDALPDGADGTADDEPSALVRQMLAAAPATRSDAAGLRAWADACSVSALRVHHLLDNDGAADDGARAEAARREGLTDGVSPLLAAELRRQRTVLELLADHGATGLRQALDASAEGRRVVRAVVSRRARGVA